MKLLYSQSTGCTYFEGTADIPPDAKPLDEQRFHSVIANPTPGKVRSHDAEGLPILIDAPAYVPTAEALCNRIDTAADAARRAVAGDPLRAVEYDRARLQAEQFAAADYQGEVPAMVAAWAINGRTPQQAADSILAEAAAYTNALELLRTTRLAAKEQVRALMAANQAAQAQQLTDQTIASIEAAVAGIGNNA
ncbi:phage tail protein [Pseudomonas sp. B11D7D]|nr:phage tail protein [Pseudomonas sp. B11D7D]QNH04446.1 phage tail protein [Pseudomonas sp. B11D7D]